MSENQYRLRRVRMSIMIMQVYMTLLLMFARPWVVTTRMANGHQTEEKQRPAEVGEREDKRDRERERESVCVCVCVVLVRVSVCVCVWWG
jgi:hypothetical protein